MTHRLGHLPRFCFALIVVLGLNGCSSATSEIGSNHVRFQAVKEAAISYGAQSGLAWRGRAINQVIESHDNEMARVFNFNAMILSHNLLPPVLQENRTSLKLDNPDVIRLADRSVEILKPARFVTTPPSWRDYINLSFADPAIPNETLLPRDAEERAVWDEQVVVGWHQGVEQAEAIYATGLGRLNRDFTGMVLYHTLLAQHMVSAPFVAKAKLGITGDKSKMRLNDQVLRITVHSELQTDQNTNWTPVIRKSE